MRKYEPQKIEPKWQKEWEKSGIYKAEDFSTKPKWYSLIEFPYPSADGLHTGHIRSNTAMDIISRKRRMEGFNVLYPIGWDAFGLPTENYAIKTGQHPKDVTKKNTDIFRQQLKSVGFSFDWDREVNTSDPAYYKWTQWIFLQLFKKGLAYKQKTFINWCPKDKCGLANEEVIAGKCERCGTPVEKREKDQWMLAITKYADRLDKDLDKVDYLPQIKLQQRNWIGRSEGSEITFELKVSPAVIPGLTRNPGEKQQDSGLDTGLRRYDTNTENSVSVFTTRADTLFGVTYVVLAPEHEIIKNLKLEIKNLDEVQKYIDKTLIETDTERTTDNKEKTGVRLEGIMAINPANNEEVPVFIADYVLASYGTGAVMAVPAHDERDWAFAKKYNLPIKEVIEPCFVQTWEPGAVREDLPFVEREAVMVIVKHWSEDKYICLKWKKVDWKTFITGGVEKGQTPEEAAVAEIMEETGYLHPKLVSVLKRDHSKFFHVPKQVNRFAHFHNFIFQLEDGDRNEVSREEQENHDVLWVNRSEVKKFISVEGHQYIWDSVENGDIAYTGYGILANSGNFNGLESKEAMKAITEAVGGKWVTKYKLRDWVFSRQRYWGEPIPLVFCENCKKLAESTKSQVLNNKQIQNSKSEFQNGEELNLGWVAVPEESLPVELPNVENYEPADDGESPLSRMPEWVNTTCPTCGGPAKRETDTMPNWAGSSWYFLRYADPTNASTLADFKKQEYWSPVDWYNGGAEHITLHLLYSRFWNKFLYDIGVVPFDEPYQKRTLHGMILGGGGVKMSKSKGNVVNPDETVKNYGADTLRVYEMFMGPFDQSIAWSTESIIGSRRFLDKVWAVGQKTGAEGATSEFESLTARTVKKVGEDIESMSFNTAISALMIWVNKADGLETVPTKAFESFLKILAPFAPHITEELWADLGHKSSIHLEAWPAYDEAKLTGGTVNIVVQVNGKARDSFSVPAGLAQAEVEKLALARSAVQKWVGEQLVKKTIYVPDRLISFVV